MPEIRITRGASAPSTTRAAVLAGQVFMAMRRDGRRGKTYAHIGQNGRFYSVNLETKALASTMNGDARVVLVGAFTYGVEMNPTASEQVSRSAVRSGDLFVVNDGKSGKLYAHIGTTNAGKFLSVNLGSRNHAVTDNGAKRVKVVGKLVLNVREAA